MRRRGEVDRSRGTLGGGLQKGPNQRTQDREERRLVLGAERRAHDAGVQHGGRDPTAPQAARQLVGEHDVGQLRGVVGVLTGVFLLTLQVVEVEAACCMGAGGHSHDPYGCTGYEPVEQQVGE